MKNYFYKCLPRPITFAFFFTLLTPLKSDYLNAEYLFEELEIDSSTKTEDDSSALPTNPSDAINDALKSFNSLEEK